MDVDIVLFKKDGRTKTFQLPSESSVLGRRHDCDLQIALKEVSKRHCQLTIDNSTLKVRDLGSTNGTFVNGERIDEIEAKGGDYITITIKIHRFTQKKGPGLRRQIVIHICKYRITADFACKIGLFRHLSGQV